MASARNNLQNAAGVYPSSAVGDAAIAFTRNGDIYQHQHRTVLGVAIKGHQFDLAPYNALNPDFGYPMTVCTNLWYASQIRLVTNVKLPGGYVRLELADASGQFTVWYEDIHGGTYRKLLDTSSTRVKNLTMAYWKALIRRATNGDTAELPIYITSSAPGTVTLKFRNYSGEARKRTSEHHVLYEEHNTKSLIFLHGANVAEADAEVWGDVLFKRLWLSGMHADFYNVDWRSDIGTDLNYQQNASNAFVVASQIVSTLTNSIPGEKVIMAHSLGNMVVSSMIHDYGLQVSKYLMCNSAVPAEAFDVSMSLRTSKLVHPEWEEYPTNSWTASWHTLFKNDLNDDRKYLGWPRRFSRVLNVAVNFYSTGDEVLELAIDNDVDIFSGVTNSLAHHSWHKQELFKGRGLGVGAGATDWSGWNIEEDWLGRAKISVEQALDMDDVDFKTNTVFYCYPASMNSTNISLLVRGAHLALGIPALTPAAGAIPFGGNPMLDSMVNVNANNSAGVERPNGWPSKPSYPNRWLHSDMKDVSYFFNFKFYEKVIEKGNLR